MIELILDVVTFPTVFIAVVGGMAFGAIVLGATMRDPRYMPKATAREVGVLVAGLGVMFGGVFYVGQIAAAAVDGDAQWPRAAARYALWVMFAVATGLGSYIELRR